MIRKLLTLLVSVLLVPLAWSQERAIRPVTSEASSATRQALVIGNSEYEYAGRLRNPVNDARAIGSTLQQLGFEVTTLTNLDQRQMERSIKQFGRQLRDSKGVGFFYYAGHGMQFNGENYLLPTDIDPSTEEDVRYDAVPLGKLLAQMRAADNKMNVVVLDACRNNPFSRSFRTFNPGLAQINAAAGTFISFATAPGQIAADGEGSNGLFTSKLLDHIGTTGLKIEEVFKRTTADVYSASNKRQAPWVQYSVIGDFYFAPGGAATSAVAVDVKPSQQAPKKQIKQEPAVVLSGEAAKKKLLETNECSGCDLTGTSLTKIDLSYSNLAEAKLLAVNFKGSNLKGSNLHKANLNGSDLRFADLSGATLTEANLVRAMVDAATLEDADLRKANLFGANLGGTNFRNAILREANLSGVTLHKANIEGADLWFANLKDVNLIGVKRFRGASLGYTKFCNTTMPDGSINNRDC